MLYSDVLGGAPVHGKSVAVIGAGGIGFDVAEYLTHDTSHAATSLDTTAFMKEWGVDMSNTTRGGLLEPVDSLPAREVFLLQRKKGALGTGLGKTTGWIHRATLRKKAVKMLSGVEYVKVDDAGLHIKVHPKKSGPAIEQILDVDHVVVCAGQESVTGIMEPLKSAGVPAFEIGGAEHGAFRWGACAIPDYSNSTLPYPDSRRAGRKARNRPGYAPGGSDRDSRGRRCFQPAHPIRRRLRAQRPQVVGPQLLMRAPDFLRTYHHEVGSTSSASMGSHRDTWHTGRHRDPRCTWTGETCV
mmetsp:Transcript_84136/g.238653  ORF Transcript_84136/g.238653 Transcript_84136/m.238653 type:complete len:299 (+) Transcript_84136:1721-2617(+)